MSHLRPEHALTVVTLPPDDAERVEAYRHAETCEECAALLREHEAMLQLLDTSFAPAPVSPALAARVHTSLYPRRWPRLVLVSIWLASLALALGSGHRYELAVDVGAHCALSEALFAVAPLAAGLLMLGRMRMQPVGYAVITGVAGLLGQGWLRSHCPVHGAVLHSFVFHFLVVVALSLVGGAIGRKVAAQRA